jgi:hypothetical protein
MDPTTGYTSEANGMAGSHNLTMLSMALPMLVDSGPPGANLPALGGRGLSTWVRRCCMPTCTMLLKHGRTGWSHAM